VSKATTEQKLGRNQHDESMMAQTDVTQAQLEFFDYRMEAVHIYIYLSVGVIIYTPP
jgi:hypothetical protein